MPQWRLILCVLLPFASGYYLSYFFRTINALIAGDLKGEFGLSAADLGFLTSVYFLVFAAVQLPFGVLLDRYGPRIVQSVLLFVAALGALAFALAEGLTGLIIGRALISLGVAIALAAGLKAIILWFPADRLALATGWLVMLGALGALTATAPADIIVQGFGWRGLFALLAAVSALSALLVIVVVPERPAMRVGRKSALSVSLSAIFQDARFWRIAPLSATGVSASWSLQGLWAAPWLSDVEGLERSDVVQHLSIMAVAVCVGALLLGLVADRLRRVGKGVDLLLAVVLGLSMLAQLGLVLRWPIPSHVSWTVIGAAGAATVLSFAILPEYFPKEATGRANAALSLLHVLGAFLLQLAAGIIIEQWPQAAGKYPAEAYQAAVGLGLALQVAALAWFSVAHILLRAPTVRPVMRRSVLVQLRRDAASPSHYDFALAMWIDEIVHARQQARSWRLAAAASLALGTGLAITLSSTVTRSAAALHFVETHRAADNLGNDPALAFVVNRSSTPRSTAPGAVAVTIPWTQLVAEHSIDRSLGEATQGESPSASPLASAKRQRSQERPKAVEVSKHVHKKDSPEIVRISVPDLREAALRRHGSERSHQQRGVRRVLPERAHGVALRPTKSTSSEQYTPRHTKARIGVRWRDALAGYGPGRHTHQGRRTLVSHARTSSLYRGAQRSHCPIARCADRRKKPRIDATAARDRRGAALDKPTAGPEQHAANTSSQLICGRARAPQAPRQKCTNRHQSRSFLDQISEWLANVSSGRPAHQLE